MNIPKISAELIGGPLCGQRRKLYPFVKDIIEESGKYIRDGEQTEAGHVVFRWVFNQKEVVK